MKKRLPFIIAILSCCVFYCKTNQAIANVIASQLNITNPDGSSFDGNFSDGTGAKISFYLNDSATEVTIRVRDISNGSVVAQIEGGAMNAGLNSVAWDGSGAESGKNYIYEITALQPTASATDWTVFFDSGDIDIFTRGVDVVTDQSDPNFGLIFTSNDGGPLQTGINIYNPDGSFHDPFLVAASVQDGGVIDYGTDAPLFATMDYMGNIWVSLKDLGKIMRINRDFTGEVVIEGLTLPKGLYVEGEGEGFTIYVAADNKIWRGNIGTANSFDANTLELLADFSGFFPHQINMDDDGFLYVSLRSSNELGSDGRGIRKYDISGTLPVIDDDALWFLGEEKTFIANDLVFDRGSDGNSAADDILYFVTRAGGGRNEDGIWRIDDINSIFPDVIRIITEVDFYGFDDNVQARATFDFDAAGNIIFMENANEHVFFISPPGVADTNSFTTTSPDTFSVSVTVDVEEPGLAISPKSYELYQNYPNPFNPGTTIKFSLGQTEIISLRIFDLNGRLIRTLIKSEKRPSGLNSVEWDGKDKSGSLIPSGRYVYTLESGKFKDSKVMTLLK